MDTINFYIPGQEKFVDKEESKFIWVEELSELQKAITKYERGLLKCVDIVYNGGILDDDIDAEMDKRREDVREELADVLICCMQIIHSMEFTHEEVQNMIDKKRKRNDDRYLKNRGSETVKTEEDDEECADEDSNDTGKENGKKKYVMGNGSFIEVIKSDDDLLRVLHEFFGDGDEYDLN